MVISGLMPRDYISPLDELFNTIKETETKNVAELKKIVDDKVNEITNLMTTLNQTNTATLSELNSAKTALEALEDKIKQDGLFTQEEAKEFEISIQKLIADSDQTVTDQLRKYEASRIFTDDDIPDYLADSWEHIITSVPHEKNTVNIAFITDNHVEEGSEKYETSYSGDALKKYKYFARSTFSTKPDIVLLGGDNINGNVLRDDLMYTNKHVRAIVENINLGTPIFELLGNHDTGIGQAGGLNPSKTLTENDIRRLYKTSGAPYGEKRNDDSLYFYYDVKINGQPALRVIGLNSSDSPYTTTSGNYDYDKLHFLSYQQEQLNWLANQALQTTLPVIVFTHSSETDVINSDVLYKILLAFKNRNSATLSSSNSGDLGVHGLFVDFSNLPTSTLVALVSGHTHEDYSEKSTLEGTARITVDADLTNSLPGSIERRFTSNDPCWEVLSINLDSRVMREFRFGRGTERSFTF
ncbi:hypothetical protein LEQ_1159 [Ligilactobacillus equi DPC 6820]|uniref:Calcineurin-like phosphoesterase domain-containing protein n=2 Tax=Ligilactobacillus equi TaxID=137357 RepID=V7I1E1_9LACO|nr:hypothetical protein LEQ_1159 [Ligilactobacillus equi DPC 6820]